MREPRIIVGIDCATRAGKTGLAFAEWDGGQARVTHAERGSGTGKSMTGWAADVIRERISGRVALLALDSPLGWPMQLGAALSGHTAGKPLNSASADELFSRETDRRVWKHYKKKPLEVGADRIARTAQEALNLLDCLGNGVQSIPPLLGSRNAS